MRLIALFVFLVGISSFPSPLSAQSPSKRRVVALDGGSARLLEACCPKTDYDLLLPSETGAYQAVNRHAWSLRNASCLVYRSDQLSTTARLFRDRMIAQGVRAIDLAAYAAQQKQVARQRGIANDPPSRVSEHQSFVMTLAIEQYRKFPSGF